MKKLFILISLILLCSLNAQVIGKFGFIQGKVQYKDSLNGIYKTAERNMPVHKDGYLNLDLASSAEIIFDGLSTIQEEGRKEFSILELYNKARKPKTMVDWFNNIRNNIITNKTERPKIEAGIRRDQQVLPEQELYYWEPLELQKLEDAASLYDKAQYSMAAEKFEKIIEQAPLSAEAEAAHIYLLMIYRENLNNRSKAEEHLETYKRDFPNSENLKDLLLVY